MDCYRVIKEVGDGTFGCVWRAVNKFTGEVVAIKKMKKKYYTWEECMNLREVKSLRMMEHPNIVKLKEVIREHDILYLVFEYMELDLYQLMKDRTKLFSEAEIRSWCFQVFHALAYMHHRGCFHRDLKPENLLVTKDIIKVADFGLAREVCSKPPYTEYVSTRWYRAPEVLLQSPIYGAEVDMWAMGAIMAELFTLRPLFPGSSEVFELSHPDGIQSEFHYDSRDLFPASGAGNDSEVDEIYKICSVIGSPNQNSWAEGLRLANEMKYQFPQSSGVPLSALIPSASEDAVSLITILCSWDPRRRPSAAEALQHPFFQPCHYYVPPSLRPRATGTTHHTSPSVGTKEAVEQRNAGRRYSLGALSANYTCAIPIMKPAINFSTKANTSLQAGVQRKLEMDYQGTEKNNEKTAKTRAQRPQPRYQPPLRNNNPGSAHPRRPPVRVSEAASKLGQMTLGGPAPRPPQAEWRQQEVPPPMKAGGWHGQPDLLGRPHEIPAAARTAPGRLSAEVTNHDRRLFRPPPSYE